MDFQTYRQYDGLGLADLVRQGSVTAAELTELAIARAEAVNPKLNAIIHPLYDTARAMSEAVNPAQAFAGVPFLLKDLGLEISGTPRCTGSRGYRAYVSSQDSYLVERFRAAGLCFLGKTNTPEFGLTPYTEPALFGPTRNPWALDRTPGGSSGGSAAAVAAGIVPLATASDGGGSIRIPASCCGLFGLKPSRGRLSLGPNSGDMWDGAVMEHCVSRSVRDSAALLDAISGLAPGDPYGLPAPPKPYLELMQQRPGKLRIAFSTAHTLGQDIHPANVAAVHHTARLLETLGHEVSETALPYRREDLTETFIMMIFGQAAADVAELSQFLGRPATAKDVELTTLSLSLLGKAFSAVEYASARRRWNELGRRVAAFHEDYDLILTPTVALPPFEIGHLQPSAAEQRLLALATSLKLSGLLKRNVGEIAEQTFGYIPFTPFANMTGQPSMSVPLYWEEEGLPVGSMFTAPIGREDMLFQLAAQLEEAQPWMQRVPNI